MESPAKPYRVSPTYRDSPAYRDSPTSQETKENKDTVVIPTKYEIPIKMSMIWTCSTHAWYAGPIGKYVAVAPSGSPLQVVTNSQGESCPWDSFAWEIVGPRTAGFIQAIPLVGILAARAPVIGLYGGGCTVAWSGFDQIWLSNFRSLTDKAASTTHWVEAPINRQVTVDHSTNPPTASFTSPTTNALLHRPGLNFL
ncbi:hypothetical protein TWF281_001719 [Arthrobotrys megalospora]